jgi:hypothetical protein
LLRFTKPDKLPLDMAVKVIKAAGKLASGV